jgi:ribose transport system substrate-binding protein
MLYQQGYKGIQTAIAAAQGKTVDARVDTGTGLVTPDNVKQFIIDNHLQQFMQ